MTKFYTVREVAGFLNVKERTVRESWIPSGKLKSHKFGGEHRISQEQLDEFIKSGERKEV